MEFGKLENTAALDTIDFTLPPDPAATTDTLEHNNAMPAHTDFYVGTTSWGHKSWVGKLYPPGTKTKDYLKEYARQFNCVELNAFAYGLPAIKQIHNWKEQADHGFLFCPKFSTQITHEKQLKNTSSEVNLFLETVYEFGEQLGPIFLMPSPKMGVKEFDTITGFISALPLDISVFLELRHPEWFAAAEGFHRELFHFLQDTHKGTVITDTAGRRDCVHMHLPVPECFIRFVGNGLHPTDYLRIDSWVQRLKSWMQQGLKRCYLFMHEPDELHSPELVKYFVEQMNAHCGTTLKPPVMQHTLF